jgi:hypothetical protein
MSENELPEEVGYGKTPMSGRFKKGQSGNPKGRPKGSINLNTAIVRASRETVRVNGPRGPRSMTKLAVTLSQLGNKAAQGDARAQREFLSQVRMAEEAVNSGSLPSTSREMDRKVLENFKQRLEKASIENASTKPESEKEKS